MDTEALRRRLHAQQQELHDAIRQAKVDQLWAISAVAVFRGQRLDGYVGDGRRDAVHELVSKFCAELTTFWSASMDQLVTSNGHTRAALDTLRSLGTDPDDRRDG